MILHLLIYRVYWLGIHLLISLSLDLISLTGLGSNGFTFVDLFVC